MKLDTRLYFLKDPFLYIPLFLFLGGLGMIIKNEQPKAIINGFYHSTPNTTVQHISGKVSK